MMQRRLRQLLQRLLTLVGVMVLASCVSVNLGPKGAQKSKDVDFKAPAGFSVLKETRADGAWQNSANGNSVSYLSTCSDPADPSIEAISRELFVEMQDLTTLRSRTTTYNGREALDTEVEGKVDGVITRIRAVVFKKNDCSYTLTYIGIPKHFEADRGRFDDFLKNFRAP